MDYDYGFGALENELIQLFHSGVPDFEAAEDLIRQGADINAIGKNDDKNVLSEILFCYPDILPEPRDDNNGVLRERSSDSDSDMCAIIRFFLAHGFDVTKCDGCYGAQCLHSLTTTTDRTHFIQATKLLLDAGAVNRTLSPTSDDDLTPWEAVGDEQFFLDCYMNDLSAGNDYEAVYQIYQAIENGKPYRGIDSYSLAIGKRIRRVLADNGGKQPVFYTLNQPKFKHNNCYTATLYFIYDDGVLISTQFADFWTNTILPSCELTDVSEHFEAIVGKRIEHFIFNAKTITHRTRSYTQLITTIVTDSGEKISFTTNDGEVGEEYRAAYYEIIK